MDVSKLMLIDECAAKLDGASSAYLEATEPTKRSFIGAVFAGPRKSKVREQLEIGTALGAFFQMHLLIHESWGLIKLTKAKALEEVILKAIMLLCKDYSSSPSTTVEAVLAIHEKSYSQHLATWGSLVKTKPSSQLLRTTHDEIASKIFEVVEDSLQRQFKAKYKNQGSQAASKFLADYWDDEMESIVDLADRFAPFLSPQ